MKLLLLKQNILKKKLNIKNLQIQFKKASNYL